MDLRVTDFTADKFDMCAPNIEFIITGQNPNKFILVSVVPVASFVLLILSR